MQKIGENGLRRNLGKRTIYPSRYGRYGDLAEDDRGFYLDLNGKVNRRIRDGDTIRIVHQKHPHFMKQYQISLS